MSICSGKQLNDFAASIGWFDIEPSEISKRKSPQNPAKNYKIGFVDKGLDGRKWIVVKYKNGKRWQRYNYKAL